MTKEFKRDSIWIARDGCERRVICIDSPEPKRPIVSLSDDGTSICSHLLCGGLWEGELAPWDLIREKREPREFWINVTFNEILPPEWTPNVADGWIKVREVIE